MRLVLTCLLTTFLLSLSTKSSAALTLHCPSDVWLNCGDEIWDLSLYGNAYYIHHGVTYDAGLAHVNYNLTTCNTGSIVRTWTVEDENWNIYECSQTIYISGGNFQFSNIYWPHSELLVTGCQTSIDPDQLPVGYQEPTWDYVTCSQVASSYNDQVFNFGSDCKKILRRWTVIDWCNYTPGGSKGIYTYSQVIKVSNMEVPLLSCSKVVTVKASRCDSSYVKTNGVTVEGVSCTGGYLIENDSPYAEYPGADASGTYPIGITDFNYIVEYACGQKVICESQVIVESKNPVPYCYATLNVVLMPIDSDNNGSIDDGMVEVWAKDLDLGSYHPCDNQELQISFSSDVNDQVRFFSCDEVGLNTVEMWVTDRNGLQSYCLVTINVQNNAANIPDCTPDIGAKFVFSGEILNEDAEPLENVIVTAKDDQPIYEYETEVVETHEFVIIDSFYNEAGLLLHIFDTEVVFDTIVTDSSANINVKHLYTNEDGKFGSNEIIMDRNYEMSAYRSGDMSVVDQNDLSLLNAYLAGRYTFESPYSYIAADINEDNVLDELDYKLLSDLVSGEEDEWPLERQWVFYNAAEMGEMSENPLEDNMTNEIMVLSNETRISKINLMGVLKGDIDKHESFREENDLNRRSKDEVSIYPNPFSEKFVITNPNGEELSISIFSIEGRLILEKESSASSIEFDDTEDMQAGTYFYQIEHQKNLISGKIIKL